MSVNAVLFKALLGDSLNRPLIRSALLTRWFFNAASALTMLFMQVLIYDRFQSLTFNIFCYAVTHTALMIALCGVGYFAHELALSTRSIMKLSAVVLLSSFVWFVVPIDRVSAIAFFICYGAGQGLYWLANNYYELHGLVDAERDVYASALVWGRKVVAILTPFVGTLALYAAHISGVYQYTYVLCIAAFLFLFCIIVTRNVESIIPPRVTKKDAQDFFKNVHHAIFQLFTAATALQEAASTLMLPLIAVVILGTVETYGLFTTVASCIGMGSVYLTSFFRTRETRVLYLAIGYGSIALCSVLVSVSVSLWALFLYMLAERMLLPLGAVSLHALAVFSIERMSTREAQRYASMLFRDLSIWFWRMCAATVLYVCVSMSQSSLEGLRLGVLVYAVSALCVLYAGWVLHKTRT